MMSSRWTKGMAIPGREARRQRRRAREDMAGPGRRGKEAVDQTNYSTH